MNAANFCRGEDDELGLFDCEEGLDVVLASEVQLGMAAEDEVGEP